MILYLSGMGHVQQLFGWPPSHPNNCCTWPWDRCQGAWNIPVIIKVSRNWKWTFSKVTRPWCFPDWFPKGTLFILTDTDYKTVYNLCKFYVIEQGNTILLQFGEILKDTLAAPLVLPRWTRPALNDQNMREDPPSLLVMKDGTSIPHCPAGLKP